MFLEVTEEVYEKIRPMLFEMGVEFEASDCTLEGEQVPHLHLEFENLTEQEAQEIAKNTDECFRLAAAESKQKEREGNF